MPMISTYPDFTDRQYQVQRELGHNREGGRISYLANRLNRDPSSLVTIVLGLTEFAGEIWA
jgi:hypothetical protein